MVYSELGVRRIKEGKNWAYVFEDESRFSQLGHKLMQPQDGLLRCARVRYNGRLKLIYFTEDFQSLSHIFTSLQTNGVYAVLYKLLTAVLKIRDNGFLSCTNVDISPECIFFDAGTLEPHLIYLPVAADGREESMPEFEQELRRNLLNGLRSSGCGAALEAQSGLAEMLADSRGGLEGLAAKLAGGDGSFRHQSGVSGGGDGSFRRQGSPSGGGTMVLQCVSEGITGGFAIDKDRYIIGRRKENDGVLDFSNSISRVHCSIVRSDGAFYITDEGSRFGTFVNGVPCGKGQFLRLQDGDSVRLANIEFKVKM